MASNKSYEIYNIYSKQKQSNRDEIVLSKIDLFIKNNIDSITDGILYKVPKLSAEQRDIIAREYCISDEDWHSIQKLPEFKNMKKLASPLNLGLLISYFDTKNKMFLVFLFILHYSSVYMKYCTKGTHNAMVMKYTIDTSDNRTDFKRYECSLIAVVTKKIEAYLNNYQRILKVIPPTDTILRELLQASKTRLNEMFKTLYGKYKENLNSDDVKVMMEYTQTADGKHVLSMQNVFEKLADVTAENLFTPSDTTLNRVGLSVKNTKELKYRLIIIRRFSGSYRGLSTANTMILDKWISQNNNRMTIDNFKSTFIKSMMRGRNIKHIYNEIDKVVDKMVEEELAENPEDVTYNKVTLRNYVYSYLVMNIYQCSAKVFNK